MAGNDHPDFNKPVMVAGTAGAAQSSRGEKGRTDGKVQEADEARAGRDP